MISFCISQDFTIAERIFFYLGGLGGGGGVKFLLIGRNLPGNLQTFITIKAPEFFFLFAYIVNQQLIVQLGAMDLIREA